MCTYFQTRASCSLISNRCKCKLGNMCHQNLMIICDKFYKESLHHMVSSLCSPEIFPKQPKTSVGGNLVTFNHLPLSINLKYRVNLLGPQLLLSISQINLLESESELYMEINFGLENNLNWNSYVGISVGQVYFVHNCF